jgi:hypothetical protein
MDYQKKLDLLKKLAPGDKKLITEAGSFRLSVIRPSEVYQDYSPTTNFRILLEKMSPYNRIPPQHFILFTDLYARSISRPDLRSKLLLAFDEIYYEQDVDYAIREIRNEKFEQYSLPLEISGNLSQLFIIEQNSNYHRPSHFDPISLFYQGWLRQIIIEADKLVVEDILNRGAYNRPPSERYTRIENKKNKDYYNPNYKKLWYLENF